MIIDRQITMNLLQRRMTLLLLVAAVLAMPSLAFSWDDIGHALICEMAFQQLDDPARAEVTRLIEADPEFEHFRDSCSWADHSRKREPEHYANYPRETLAVTTDQCVTDDVCVLSAIHQDAAVLADPDATKLESLKYLGHWVGDLHQPFHVSFADDRGGNSVTTEGVCAGNLHSAWDSCLVHALVLRKEAIPPELMARAQAS